MSGESKARSATSYCGHQSDSARSARIESTATGGSRLKFGHKIPTAVIPAFDDQLRKTASDRQIILPRGIQKSNQI